MATERARTMDPREMYDTLLGRVPDKVITRAMQLGGIPESGPGRYSIPNALENTRCITAPPTSKAQRAQWNFNHRLNPFGR